jgi:hypothetical protein
VEAIVNRRIHMIVLTEQIGERLSLSPALGKGARDVRLAVEIRNGRGSEELNSLNLIFVEPREVQ